MNDLNNKGLLQKPGKVIYIGLQGAQILQVTRHSLDYIDQNEKMCSIDLEECAKNWCLYWDQHRGDFILLGNPTQEEVHAENATTIALRGIRYVQFMDEKRTRFEFANDLERWKLQEALFSKSAGVHSIWSSTPRQCKAFCATIARLLDAIHRRNEDPHKELKVPHNLWTT